jgi:hypothetical protein
MRPDTTRHRRAIPLPASRIAIVLAIAAVAATPACGPSGAAGASTDERVAQTSSAILPQGPILQWEEAWMPNWTNAAGIAVVEGPNGDPAALKPAIVLYGQPGQWTKTVELDFWPTTLNSESWPAYWSPTSSFTNLVSMMDNSLLFYDASSGYAETDEFLGTPHVVLYGQNNWASDPMLFVPMAPFESTADFSFVSYDQATGHVQLHDDSQISGTVGIQDYAFGDTDWTLGYTHFTPRSDHHSFLAYKRDTGTVKVVQAFSSWDQQTASSSWWLQATWVGQWTTGWDVVERVPVESDDAGSLMDGYLLYDHTSGLMKIVRETYDAGGNVTGVALQWEGTMPPNMNIVRPYCARTSVNPSSWQLRFFGYDGSAGTARLYTYDAYYAGDNTDRCGYPWSL